MCSHNLPADVVEAACSAELSSCDDADSELLKVLKP
jgi:hypothetical protein